MNCSTSTGVFWGQFSYCIASGFFKLFDSSVCLCSPIPLSGNQGIAIFVQNGHQTISRTNMSRNNAFSHSCFYTISALSCTLYHCTLESSHASDRILMVFQETSNGNFTLSNICNNTLSGTHSYGMIHLAVGSSTLSCTYCIIKGNTYQLLFGLGTSGVSCSCSNCWIQQDITIGISIPTNLGNTATFDLKHYKTWYCDYSENALPTFSQNKRLSSSVIIFSLLFGEF